MRMLLGVRCALRELVTGIVIIAVSVAVAYVFSLSQGNLVIHINQHGLNWRLDLSGSVMWWESVIGWIKQDWLAKAGSMLGLAGIFLLADLVLESYRKPNTAIKWGDLSFSLILLMICVVLSGMATR